MEARRFSLAAGGLEEGARDGEEGGLAGAGRPHDQDHLSGSGLQADIFQCGHGSLAGAVDLGGSIHAEDDFSRSQSANP